MRTLQARHFSTSPKIGTFATLKGVKVLKTDTAVFDADTKELLFVFSKGIIDKNVSEDLCKLVCVPHRRNDMRGAAAGPLTAADVRPSQRQINHFTLVGKSGFETSKRVRSCVVGLTGNGSVSAWSRKQESTRPLLSRKVRASIDAAFKLLVPKVFTKQKRLAAALGCPLIGSLFTSISVNHNFRTGVHRDKDKANTMSAMIVGGSDSFKGSELIFTEYRIACDVRVGDLIIFDPRLLHGNARTYSGPKHERYSLVFYQK